MKKTSSAQRAHAIVIQQHGVYAFVLDENLR
jgi:hypothetical protein